jgi:hypothetical protein
LLLPHTRNHEQFEAALLITKIMEDFLQDDVQYNFVQLFNSKQPMMPDFSTPQYNLDLGIGKDETGCLDAGHCDEMVMKYVGHDWRKRRCPLLVLLSARPPSLPLSLSLSPGLWIMQGMTGGSLL